MNSNHPKIQRQVSAIEFTRTKLKQQSLVKQSSIDFSITRRISQSNMALQQTVTKKELQNIRNKSIKQPRSLLWSNSQKQKHSQLIKKLFNQIHMRNIQIIKLQKQNQDLYKTIEKVQTENKLLQIKNKNNMIKSEQDLKIQDDQQNESITQLMSYKSEQTMLNSKQKNDKIIFDQNMIIVGNAQFIESSKYTQMKINYQKLRDINIRLEQEIQNIKNKMKNNQQNKEQLINRKVLLKDSSTQTSQLEQIVIQQNIDKIDLTKSSKQIQLQVKIEQMQNHIKNVSKHHNYLKDKCHTIRYLIGSNKI